MKYIVTGGAGFIGSNLVDKLIEDGHEDIVFDDLSTGNINLIPKDINLVKCNINDEEKVSNIIQAEKFDILLHFAGFIKVEESVQNPTKYFI